MLIAVTGTPGTGKSRFAIDLTRLLGDVKVIEANDIVEKHGLYSGIDKYDAKIVRIRPLTRHLKSEIRKTKTTTIIVGHLAADLDLHYDICVVTRSKLARLAMVFRQRRYSKEKARENLFAEALDYCGVEVLQRAKETYEVETGKDKKEIMLYIKKRVAGKRVKRPAPRQISAMPELLSKIQSSGIRL